MKKAIVIGATGMVGTQLIKLLLHTESYSEIVSFVRKPSGVSHPKLNEQIVDFDKPEKWSALIVGDVLFSTMGTTIAKAKNKDAQFNVDYNYQYWVANYAAKNGVPNYVLISSAGANSKSNAFYMKMKGQLEDTVNTLPFKVISILQPGQLAGDRKENRLGEKIGLSLMYGLNKIGLFEQYKPIQALEVAKAMIHAAEKTHSATYTLDKVFELAK
ncbi:MAG: NAD(P)H-binding protein [Paludibacter sp.]